MPEVTETQGVAALVGAIIAALAAAAVGWRRAGRNETRIDNRTERRDALKEVWELHDRLQCRFNEQQTRSDENRNKILTLTARVDECEEKHDECRRQHEDCEKKHAELQVRVESLEDSIKRP